MAGMAQPEDAAVRERSQEARRSRQVWAQDVMVRASLLHAKLDAIKADDDGHNALTKGGLVLAAEAAECLAAAKASARRRRLGPGALTNWWRGTLIEGAYQNLHAAEAMMAHLYTEAQLAAELPEAIARVEAMLGRDDPRREAALKLDKADPSKPETREAFAKAVQVGFEAADVEHARLRSFRNAIIGSAGLLTVILVVFVIYVAHHPGYMPVCFTQPDGKTQVCATGGTKPQAHDLIVVACLGVLGGLLTAIASIRNMRGTSLPYDVPTSLAVLRLPVGALAAMGGLLLIKAKFIPGLSNLDTQEQILAYAFIFGAAQQLLVGQIDRQAKDLMATVPSKAAAVTRAERT